MYEILGYPNTWTIAPGETMEFKVSCAHEMHFDADLVRTHSGDVSPGALGLKEPVVLPGIARGVAKRTQHTETGSRAVAPAFAEPDAAAGSWPLCPPCRKRASHRPSWRAGTTGAAMCWASTQTAICSGKNLQVASRDV